MNCLKKFYGKTIIDSSDSQELSEEDYIELEYYQLENLTSNKPYGIEIVKKNIQNDIMNIEDKTIRHICSKEQDNNRLLELLMNNKVTPISVDDVMEDLSKIKVI